MNRERDLLIGRDYLAGTTLAEVGLTYKLSTPQVLRILISIGVPRRRRGPRFLRYPERHALAMRLYTQGLTLQAIGSQLGVSRQRIEQMIRPDRSRARQSTRYAIKTGKLTVPETCRCGSRDLEAHHHDYSKPLEVEWLCGDCHLEAHEGRLYATAASRARA
jgi:ribosomal protein S27AE